MIDAGIEPAISRDFHFCKAGALTTGPIDQV